MNSKSLSPIFTLIFLLSVAAPAFASTGEEGTEGMTVGVSQTDGVVTVTSNGTAVENVSITVEALNNSIYAGTGSYTTDANGTVSLPTPPNDTMVEIEATKGNLTDSTTVTQLAPQEEEETGDGLFGQRVSTFIHALISGEDVRHPGRTISDWVTQHNPGTDKKSDHEGKSGDVGKNGDDHPGYGNGKKNGHGNDR